MKEIYKVENDEIVNVVVISEKFQGSAQDFALELGLAGDWIDIDLSQYELFPKPSLGFIFNKKYNLFISPQPFPSWELNENLEWSPPKPEPEDGNYSWNEKLQQWEVAE